MYLYTKINFLFPALSVDYNKVKMNPKHSLKRR